MASLITTTVQHTVTKTVSAAAAASSSARAVPQGGVLEHQNPADYDPKNPITLFIIQAGIIIILCRLLHYPLSLIRQPRVIAEVIGGIILGPSILGRIPGFTNTIFPAAAMPNLSLVANIGLILFLFLVGLEVDVRFLLSNWRVALSVGIGGMVLPFGLGCAIAWGLYHEFPATIPVSFGVFCLFVGVAMAITAFPVLCRILTELKLLSTPVGIIVLSAGVGNDVTGWILLALCVALVNAGTGLTALWVLLTCAGYALFLVYAVRPAFLWILEKNGSLRDEPSQGIIALTLLLTLTSAFFTGIIGVHPIFGAFMVGLICPHEGGFAIKVTEKIEDLISAVFLPLYFALSGLSTNLGLLNSGTIWGYVIGIIACAFFGKFIGASVAARLSGLVWRESFAIGALMSCKGLVELIVLNIGLQAKILTTQTFTMFVVMALVTTFATTPLTHALYPPWYQKKLDAWKQGKIDWDTGEPLSRVTTESQASRASSLALERLNDSRVRKLLVYLRLDNMPSILAFISLLSGPRSQEAQVHPANQQPIDEAEEANQIEQKPERRVTAHGVRLISLTDRPSSVMQVSELGEVGSQDPVVNTFRTLGQLYNIPASGEVDVVPEDSFADTLNSRASDYSSDLLFLPWSESGSISDSKDLSKSTLVMDGSYPRFILSTVQTAPCNTAIFVSRSVKSTTDGVSRPGRPPYTRTKSAQSMRSFNQVRDLPRPSLVAQSVRHVFCAVFGGPDDILALGLTLQMVEKGCTATIVRFVLHTGVEEDEIDLAKQGISSASKENTGQKLERSTSSMPVREVSPDNAAKDAALVASLRATLAPDVLARIFFETVPLDTTDATSTARTVLARATSDIDPLPKKSNSLVIVGRNWGLKGLINGPGDQGDAERCLGVVGMECVSSALKGGFVVVKAAKA